MFETHHFHKVYMVFRCLLGAQCSPGHQKLIWVSNPPDPFCYAGVEAARKSNRYLILPTYLNFPTYLSPPAGNALWSLTALRRAEHVVPHARGRCAARRPHQRRGRRSVPSPPHWKAHNLQGSSCRAGSAGHRWHRLSKSLRGADRGRSVRDF